MKKTKLDNIFLSKYSTYEKDSNVINLESLYSNDDNFKSSSTGMRQLIVKTWLDIILGEKPKVFTKEDKVENIEEIALDFFEDLSEQLHGAFAYGTIFVVPENKDGKVKFNILDPRIDKDIEFVYDEESDRLVFLTYTKEKIIFNFKDASDTVVPIRHYHYYDPDTKIYRHFVSNIKTGEQKMLVAEIRDSMIPYLVTTLDGKGLWESSETLIQDLDNTYSELLISMELSRKMVFVPESMIDYGQKKGLRATMSMKFSRFIRAYPDGGMSEDNKPTFVDGNYNPEPLITAMNTITHFISLKAGLGNGYFSYEKNGEFKTAKEISAGRNDLNLSKSRLNNIMGKLIRIMLSYINPQRSSEEYTIKFGDSIVENQNEYQEKLYNDVTNDLINIDFYLQESYKTMAIENMRPTVEQKRESLLKKNNTGLSIEENVLINKKDSSKDDNGKDDKEIEEKG